MGIVANWSAYREVNFAYGQADLSPSDAGTINEVAAYMAKNPSLQVGLDGFNDPNNTFLSSQRVSNVRNALVSAGVPFSKVQIGAFGDPQLRRDRRVGLLLSTGPSQTSSN